MMEIIYRKEIGFIYDICIVMVCLSNNREEWEEPLTMAERKREDLKYLDDVLSYFKDISFSTKLLGKRLATRRGCMLTELYRLYLQLTCGSEISVKDFGTYLTDQSRLKKAIIGHFFDDAEYRSDEEVLTKINVSDYSAEIKAELYDAILFPERYIDKVKSTYESICEAMERIYEKYFDVVKKNKVMEYLQNPEDSNFEYEHHDWIHQQGKCYAGFCIVWLYGMLSGKNRDNDAFLILGIDYDEDAKRRVGVSVDLEAFTNAMGDKIRISIIHLIRTYGEMSMVQLADSLGLSNTVVMYHLNVLKKENILQYRTNGRSVLYQINKDVFVRASEAIRELAQ